MTKRATKKQFLARAAELGIEIERDKDHEGVTYMAYAPTGFIFDGSTCHCANLGGADIGETVDYGRMLKELELLPCNDPNCESCIGEE